MKTILFVGSFLSKHRGTTSVAEKFSELVRNDYHSIVVSRKEHKLFRAVEILAALLFRRFDFMHANIYSGQSFRVVEIAVLLAKFRKKRVILALQGGALHEFYGANKRRIDKVFASADRIYSPSYFLIENFAAQGWTIDYHPNFLELKYFPYNRDRVIPRSILWVRAFSDNYQPDVAIRVLHTLRQRFPDVRLTMVGPDRGLQASVESLISELDLEDAVDIVGRVPNHELFHYYQTHSVYINTTKYESFGLAMVEAASCGVPMVSMNVGEIPYMWKDRESIMLAADGETMADGIAELFDSQELADTLSGNARKIAQKYDWQHVRNDWLKMLENI